ncbi:hypothetical protein TPHA_0B01920 [Tetrapisispora phaffii CBS 4417]|uniref:2-(3-amino-3-carboxypropyl)histidine synthase subunit 2 n=1 Tax=Tetrapisispora phaffii (strain ATCC 24235 / CBS 4417 / NBRC 1672 / NRRL Y-8282 / UCD 70-5) TaxID=1071381 RepID=G8BPD3_TETPH|nr:hypothetical protein TPHA_0B01920 [Tetrapisispora phaffii CBS 4417]CCE61864.1 hypothetical protein TPHA_0B01920 [Tetrapisispora phaffii CBS 4417]
MSDSGIESNDFVPPVLSTDQDENTFSFQKYSTTEKEREFYLGKYTEDELKEKIFDYYNLKGLIQYFKNHPEYYKVTLQFPDSLIHDSTIVVGILQEVLNNEVPILGLEKDMNENSTTPDMSTRKFWVLADTAYSACCVDEVASEHVQSQIVVHFGDACLNAIQKLPVVYSFGNSYLDTSKVIEKFKDQFDDHDAKICLMADFPNSHNITSIYKALLEENYKNLYLSSINPELANDKVTILGNSELEPSLKMVHTFGNRALYTIDTNFKNFNDDQLREEFQLFHISKPMDPHLLYLTTMFQSVSIYDIKDDTIMNGPFPSLMKRYKYMHVARTAGCIGILVNTLSLRNTKETISRLSKLIKDNGKKHYLFVVGKPNVAKLANFEAVDIWCVLGCGQSGIILDQYNEFYKPIITPYELTMALNDKVTWTGKWLVDFKQVLNEIEKGEEEKEEDNINGVSYNNEVNEDSLVPEFDAVTGRYISTSRPLRNITHLSIDNPNDNSSSSTSLIKNVSGGVLIKGTVSTSAEALQNREWSGLGSDFAQQDGYEEEGATLEQGIGGVARGYGFDRNRN